jgi:hypothetical protein
MERLMARIPEDSMTDVHLIRQDVAQARAAHEEAPGDTALQQAYQEALDRRGRAIRMIREEDRSSVRQLSAMFRVSKTIIRSELEAEDNE